MKFSLDELKRENCLKDLFEEAVVVECKKHGALRIRCASIGNQLTKFKRWRKTGERSFCGQRSFVSDVEMKKAEEMYKSARREFHNEPCYCQVKK